MIIEMTEICGADLDAVSGGNILLIPGIVGAVAAFAYGVGKDMAERDNLQCEAKL